MMDRSEAETMPLSFAQYAEEIRRAEARGAAEVRARVGALADEWEATVYKLPPGYPMTVNEFCRLWFKAPLRAALDGGDDA